jgi:hypothetical protein
MIWKKRTPQQMSAAKTPQSKVFVENTALKYEDLQNLQI